MAEDTLSSTDGSTELLELARDLHAGALSPQGLVRLGYLAAMQAVEQSRKCQPWVAPGVEQGGGGLNREAEDLVESEDDLPLLILESKRN